MDIETLKRNIKACSPIFPNVLKVKFGVGGESYYVSTWFAYNLLFIRFPCSTETKESEKTTVIQKRFNYF